MACTEGGYLLGASCLYCGAPASPVEQMVSDRKCGDHMGAHGLLGSWQPSAGIPLGCPGDAKSVVAMLDNCAGRREAKLLKSYPCCLWEQSWCKCHVLMYCNGKKNNEGKTAFVV